jgi:hypothetical protein
MSEHAVNGLFAQLHLFLQRDGIEAFVHDVVVSA